MVDRLVDRLGEALFKIDMLVDVVAEGKTLEKKKSKSSKSDVVAKDAKIQNGGSSATGKKFKFVQTGANVTPATSHVDVKTTDSSPQVPHVPKHDLPYPASPDYSRGYADFVHSQAGIDPRLTAPHQWPPQWQGQHGAGPTPGYGPFVGQQYSPNIPERGASPYSAYYTSPGYHGY